MCCGFFVQALIYKIKNLDEVSRLLLVAGVILNGLNSGLQRLDCDFECDLPCLCNLYGFCFGFSQSDIVQFHILVNSVQVSGFKFFKNITIYVHRNRDVLVTEYFLQDLRRHAAFDAARGKGMTERVEGQLSLQRFVLNIVLLQGVPKIIVDLLCSDRLVVA